MKTINRIFFKYIWNSKDKVKRIKLLKPSKDGGINMTDMGDSREVPHVNIVRKLRHSCEDVNFASNIYSNTLKQFNFIVDYCLRLHIMYKHSQTHSEHFL